MNIYEFDDFRLFLQHKFQEKLELDPSYTHRKFAQDAGITNPGFLNDVIKGRRKLSKDAQEKMIAGFSLVPTEAEFFRLLVQYGQAKDASEKQQVYSQIVFRRNRSSFSRLNPSLSRYYQDYRYPLLRTAVMASDFRGDYEELGRFVRPPMPASAVKKYIRDLCDWGLLTQDSTGKYNVTSEFVEPPSTLKDLVKQINREWIVQSIDALMNLPTDKRHVSTMLLSVSGDTKKEIEKRIEKFREEVWGIVKNDQGSDRVMQLNIQFFPKSDEKDHR